MDTSLTTEAAVETYVIRIYCRRRAPDFLLAGIIERAGYLPRSFHSTEELWRLIAETADESDRSDIPR